MSERADLHDVYVGAYVLSASAHSNLADLNAYLVTGGEGQITAIEYAPSLDEVSATLVTACDFALWL